VRFVAHRVSEDYIIYFIFFPPYCSSQVITIYIAHSEVEVEVNLRPTVSRPVCLGVRRPSGTRDQFFFLFEISFRLLRVCYFVAPFLTIGRVCYLLYNCFWALSEQSLLGLSHAELTAIFYCLIWDSPNLEGQVSIFIYRRNRVAQLYPWALGSLFIASYDSPWSPSVLAIDLAHTTQKTRLPTVTPMLCVNSMLQEGD
jgi:hypothetical protein